MKQQLTANTLLIKKSKLTLIEIMVMILTSTHVQAKEQARYFPPGTQEVFIADSSNVRSEMLENIGHIVNKSIEQGKYPGAVVLCGHKGQIIYKGVFGSKSIAPEVTPMSFDTIFDMASLTKVIATTIVIMQLVEQGKLEFDERVSYYWPEFNNNGKDEITIRHLLTHTSGLPAELPKPIPMWKGEDKGLKLTKEILMINPVGSVFLYSDVNFVILSHLIKLITNKGLDINAKESIFKPLGMKHTLFFPPTALKNNIAPTEIIDGVLRHGQAHDPVTFAMGSTGAAGLFSNASDLGIFASALLNSGIIPNSCKKKCTYFLSPLSILKMTTPQTPINITETRGFGFDIDSKYSNHGTLLPLNSYGNTGWTGTSIWIDPNTKTWLVILTSRIHPTPTEINPLIKERRLIANIIAASIVNIDVKALRDNRSR